MKSPFSKKTKLDETILITVPAKEIEEKVNKQLIDTQKKSKIKGFRQGKAPLDLVKKLYGNEIRSDVINDSVSHSFYHIVEDKGLRPVGPPTLKPKNLTEGKDVKFEATFDIYPEIKLGKLNKVNFIKPKSELTEKDLKDAILNLRKRMSKWNLKEGKSDIGDQVKINFKGYIEEKEFEGNTANDFVLELGSNSMIPGFEEGLVGKEKGEELTLDLSFPKDYHNSEFASKQSKFEIEILEVLKSEYPEMDNDFFKSVGIEAEDEENFSKEIEKRLKDDLERVIKNKSKTRLFDALLEVTPFDIPPTMVSNEINSMKEDSAKRMGVDPKKIKPEDFPDDAFLEDATKRVKLGVLLNTVISDNEIKPDAENVKKLIEERSSQYPNPQEVINWFYSNDEQLKQIEFLSLEEQVYEYILSKANFTEENLTYEECLKNN
jgi:trigger factor